MLQHCCTAFLLVGGCNVVRTNAQDVCFSVQGMISFTQYGEKNRPVARSSQSYQGDFCGALWWIRTALSEKTEWLTADAKKVIRKLESRSKAGKSSFADKPLAWETGTDGVDNYLIGIIGDWESSVDGRAFPGTVPFPDVRAHVAPIWMAYASTITLRSNSSGRLPILWHTKAESLFYLNYSVPVTVAFDSEPPYFPVSIVFRNEGMLFDTERDATGVVIKTNRLSPPYDAGFTEAEYKLLTVTNVAGIRFPSEFEFTVFRPKRGGLTNVDVEKSRSYHAVVASLEVPAPRRESYAPDPRTLRPFIVEKRFAKSDPNLAVSYVLTNRVWPATNNTGLQQILRTARQRAITKQEKPLPAELSRSKAKTVLGLVLIVTVVPAGFWISAELLKQTKIQR